MLINRTKQITEAVEIALPYYSKEGNVFYRIDEKEYVLRVAIMDAYASVCVTKPRNGYPAYYLLDAQKAEPCTKEEVLAATEQAIEFSDDTLSTVK